MSDAVTSPEAVPQIFRSRLFKPALVALLLVYFLYLVLARAPASLAAWALNQAVPNLWLTSVRGTLWQGVAGGSQVDIGSETFPLGQMRWSLSPLSLLTLNPCLTFETDVPGQMMSGEVCQSPIGTTTLENFSLDAPVSVLSELSEWELAGQISLQVISAELTGERVQSLDGRFSWQKASIKPQDAWLPLGDFGGQAEANGEGGINARMFDIAGPFSAEINASWTPGTAAWSVTGLITPKADAPRVIVEALPIIGEEVERGTFRVQL